MKLKHFLLTLCFVLTGIEQVKAQEHYEFHANDYRIADGGRVKNINYDNVNNTFTITGNKGDNNICFGLKTDGGVPGKYYVNEDECWYVVRGKGLDVAYKESSYIWWFNGFNNGGSVKPHYSTRRGDEQILAWKITDEPGMNGNFTAVDGKVILTNNGKNYVECVGLTSARTDGTATITSIDYMTDVEVRMLLGIDVTSDYINNPSFEDGNYDNWSLSNAGLAWKGVNTRNDKADWASDGDKIFGVWDGGAQSVTFSQNIQLPAGRYRLTVDMLASNGNGGFDRIGLQRVFAGNNIGYFQKKNNGTYEEGSFDNAAETYEGDNVKFQTIAVEFEVTDEMAMQDLAIGVATGQTAGSNQTWFKIDKFRLYQMVVPSLDQAVMDQTCVQKGKTLSLSYTTNETLTLTDGKKVTLAGMEITPVATANGFSFTVPADANLAIDTEYTLSIPAEIIGYGEGDTKVYNKAQEITLRTPLVFDGVYYMKNMDDRYAQHPYLGRGKTYGSGAYLCEYGIPVNILTGVDGKTQIIMADSKRQFESDGPMWTDNASNRFFTLEKKADNKYWIKNLNNDKYIAAFTNEQYQFDGRLCGDGTANNAAYYKDWTFLSVSEYNAAVEASDEAKSQDAKTQSGITNESVHVDVLNNSDFNAHSKFAVENEEYVEPTALGEAKLENQPAGLYKIKVQAFERITFFNDVVAAEGAAGQVYLEVNGVKHNIMSILAEGCADQLAGESIIHEGKYYPQDETSAKDAFSKGMYVNEMYIYLPETGDINISILNPSRYGNDAECGRWLCYQNLEVTRYYSNVVSRTTVTDGYGTICLPFDATAAGATVYNVTVYPNFVELTEANSIEAGVPYIYMATADAQTFTPVAEGTVVTEPITATSPLVGSFTREKITQNDNNYILSGGKFYLVNSDNVYVGAYKAYLHNETANNARELLIGSEETSVNALNAIIDNKVVIYDLSGRRLNSLQKGINIVNGVNVLVK